MTCIAVCKNKNGRIMMAGDRRASFGWHKANQQPKPKIRKREDMLLGATGDGFLCTLIVDIMPIPKRGMKDLDQYMFDDFYNAVYTCLVDHGYAEEHNLLKIPSDDSCEVVVSVEGRTYIIDIINTDEHKEQINGLIKIDEVSLPYATGCGDAAEAVLHYIKETKKHITKDDLITAVKIIAKLSPGCDDKVDVEIL